MWNINIINGMIIAIEAVLLVLLIYYFATPKKSNKKLWPYFFIGTVGVLNVFLYLLPELHEIIISEETKLNWGLTYNVMEAISAAIKQFVGEFRASDVSGFAKTAPWYTMAFVLGAILAVLTTASATMIVFGCKIGNWRRRTEALKQDVCDIVIGKSDMALKYAKNSPNAVLLLDGHEDKESETSLIESGYTVLRQNFSKEFLNSNYLNEKTCYNIIYCEENDIFLEYINMFEEYKNSEEMPKKICLFVEVDESKAETVRKEVVEKMGHSGCITTFSRNELFARTFVEKHPITEYMPKEFMLEDTSMSENATVNVFMLGFGRQSREIYRQFIINNQLVNFKDGEYKVFAVNYYIYDTNADEREWIIGGIGETLASLDSEKYFPLPEMPFNIKCINADPWSRQTLSEISRIAGQNNTYSVIIADTGDSYRNIDIASRLKMSIAENGRFHIFVHNGITTVKGDDNTTFYGDYDEIFTHDVIVNESLSSLAKKINEEYERISEEEKNPDKAGTEELEKIICKTAEENWENSDYFTLYSNITLAVNLRFKLHLLGLDYVANGKSKDIGKIAERYPFNGEKAPFETYKSKGIRGAVLAQEHARWNAYHLMSEWMPVEKDVVVTKDDRKNKTVKKHACITTFNGLTQLSKQLAKNASEKNGKIYTPEDFDYYINDEMLLTSAKNILPKLGYSIIERN